ncbi:MAG: DNA polymerase III subunit alpha [Flavobacteriales bacterium TMED191]|nr:MAG: DNA polymerase III subunit alpha [Flavobacteriales bacterium TMED191]|tara:strand:- start:12 stop:4451 length:4440 start_codon:yes stop_codon:yes gene_type:complete
MYLIFDTETIGLPTDFNAHYSDVQNWETARCVQLAWQLHDKFGVLIDSGNDIIKPQGFEIPQASIKIHRITNEIAQEEGRQINYVLEKFSTALSKANFIIGHNVSFDINVIGSEYFRNDNSFVFPEIFIIDTMKTTVEFCKIRIGEEGVIQSVSPAGSFKDFYKFKVVLENNRSGLLYRKSESMPNLSTGDIVSYEINNKGTIKVRKGFKSPKLEELYEIIFSEKIINAHNASADVDATARCFFELLRQKFFTEKNSDLTNNDVLDFISKNPSQIKLLNIGVEPKNAGEIKFEDISLQSDNNHNYNIDKSSVIQIRCYSSYSVLQSTISINQLVNHVSKEGMKAVAITDKGNLFGAFEFASLCKKNQILPIIGCDFYLVQDRSVRQGGFSRDRKDKRYSQVLYAKNLNGYKNLCKISSLGYVDGLYAGFPRVDKDLIKQYKDDLIATSSGIYGEIASLFLNVGVSKAKECFLWWLNEFKENFYIELSHNNIDDEDDLNKLLITWSKEYNVKCLPANRVFYLNQKDAKAHDALLCVKNGEQMATPKGVGHGYRFGLSNDNFYFKNVEETIQDFSNTPNVFSDLTYFVSQFDLYDLSRDVLLPRYDLPENFNSQIDYLSFLCKKGAEKRYKDLSQDIKQRIDFELKTIEKTGYPGYFLIVQDIINHAREMGVSVGPGRGSVGGSVVAYCLNITTVDPIKYDLLFERFLNPERISMPDIDIDFDDVGRSKLIAWVVEKYGSNQVAQIITYGRMAAKSSVRDMGRVLNVPLSKVDTLAKKIPGITLNEIFSLNEKELSAKLSRDEMSQVNELVKSVNNDKDESELISLACSIEGSIRNLGTHACGIIITPDDITNYIPVCTNTDSDLLITQFDNSVVEQAGMLKMDFLGLNTLSQIKDAVYLIHKRHGLHVDIDNVDLNDEKTFALYQKGETLGTFQFESAGMQKHLRALKPDKFEDLIAMNALYRPGPMEYIPNFIERKHGREQILYDLPVMEKYLGNTYGITVYQEQVMKLSQELAGFTEGKADVLRKAMGKKKKNILDGLKEDFFDGCSKRHHDLKIIEKIWRDWESFASYAFNKSHSTCYSFISFQTAYLKAHFPEEFMASLLTHHMSDLSKLSKYMDECKRMSIRVLGPDVNESWINYSVNESNDIRFGLGAIKGVGTVAAESIINQRKDYGPYVNFIDFLKRVDGKVVNKRVLEALALGGAFDSVSFVNRANFFKKINDVTFIESAIQFRSQLTRNSEQNNQLSIFNQSEMSNITDEPILSNTEEWNRLEMLNKEKMVLGLYASGHPLDDYSLEVKYFCTNQLKDIDLFTSPVRNFSFSGYVQSHTERISKNDQPYGILILEDYSGTREFRLFGDTYIKFRNYFINQSLLFFSASIVKQKWGNGGLRVNIDNVLLLSSVSDKLINEIVFNIPIDIISPEFIDSIVEIISKYPGKQNLKFNILEKDVNLNLLSKKYRVQICSSLVSDMSVFAINFALK